LRTIAIAPAIDRLNAIAPAGRMVTRFAEEALMMGSGKQIAFAYEGTKVVGRDRLRMIRRMEVGIFR